MRADRLLSLLLLLQARGRLTARKLAEELEVSERTIYRDIDALSFAGVPIYAERGLGGGFDLLDGYRTNLTGLTEDEVRALFMLSVPGVLTQLGVAQKLKAALLKLSAALPAERRGDEAWVRQRIYLDWSGWAQSEEPAPHLQTIQQAVWEDRKLHLTYRIQYGTYSERFERLVDAYGLVAKGGVWHVVCAGEERIMVHRVSSLLNARQSDEHFGRPAGFDLVSFWKQWCTESEGTWPHYPVTVRISPALVAELPQHLGDSVRSQITETTLPGTRGWITLTLVFESLSSARALILGCGGAIEVLEPEALRLSVADFALQTAALYEVRGQASTDTCS